MTRIYISEILETPIPNVEEKKDNLEFARKRINNLENNSFRLHFSIKVNAFLLSIFPPTTPQSLILGIQIGLEIMSKITKIPIDFIQNPTENEYIEFNDDDVIQVHSRNHDLSEEEISKQWDLNRIETDEIHSFTQ